MRTIWVSGDDLTPALRKAAMKHFKYRYTGNHMPNWVLLYRTHQAEGGMWTFRQPARCEFINDSEWFEKNKFPLNRSREGFAFMKQPRRFKQ